MNISVEKVVFKSDISSINLVEKLIDEISGKHNLHSDVYGKLLLAVVEGVNNAIVHGNKMEKGKDVVLEYHVDEKNVEFIIKDEGPGFDYKEIPDPTLPENIEKTHGRGIFLMNHLADDIEFDNNGSQVKLIFNL